jgi:CRP-like cAMP-binding protein
MFYQLLKPYISLETKKTVSRNEIIYHQGDHPKSLYLVENGLVGLFHISESGKETFLRVFGQNAIFGHRSFLAEKPYHAQSMALQKTELLVLDKAQFVSICDKNPQVTHELLKLLANDLGQAELRMAGLQDKTANQRIAESLVFLKHKYPQQVWTRKEIAEFSGSTFETVARVMTKLSDLKLIKKLGRDFQLIDSQKILNLII